LPFLADTNVLLRLAEPQDPDHEIVQDAVRLLISRGEEICYSPQNLVEFWNVCTRPVEHNGFGLSPAAADERAKVIESAFRLLPDTALIHAEWRRLVVEYGVTGVKVHDTRLVAAMFVHDVTNFLTLNERDFSRFPRIRVVSPRSLIGRTYPFKQQRS
jgi:predicted nucleic acid-binding protein